MVAMRTACQGLGVGVALLLAAAACTAGDDVPVARPDVAALLTRAAALTGSEPCDPETVDLATDPDNCGRCGYRCPDGAWCSPGLLCHCPVREVVCDGACVDLRSERSHCGRCGAACEFGEVCERGRCVPE